MSTKAEISRVGVVEIWVSYVLRAGVVVSLILIVTGAIVTLVRHWEYFTSASSLKVLTGAGVHFPRDLRAIAASALAGRGRGLVMAGLFALICTPVVRVAMTLLVFLFERDKAYVILSAIVLALLTVSFLTGKAGG